MNIKEFIRKPVTSIEVEWADSNPNMDSDPKWQANHYKVKLRRAGKQLTTYFSMGIALSNEPSAEDVLDCLASDACGVENARSFEDWCSEYGYDTDSRKAEKTFKLCTKQARQLRQFLGDDDYQTLLWKTERL
jgi:hypothetical protein